MRRANSGLTSCFLTDIIIEDNGPEGDVFRAESNDCDVLELDGSDDLFSVSLADPTGTAIDGQELVFPQSFDLWDHGEIVLDGTIFLIRAEVVAVPEADPFSSGFCALLVLLLLRKAMLRPAPLPPGGRSPWPSSRRGGRWPPWPGRRARLRWPLPRPGPGSSGPARRFTGG